MSTEQQHSSTSSGPVAVGEGLDRLEALPVRDIDGVRAAALKDAAREAFVARHDRVERRGGDIVLSLYHRALEPALVTTLCCAYLGWALTKVLAFYP